MKARIGVNDLLVLNVDSGMFLALADKHESKINIEKIKRADGAEETWLTAVINRQVVSQKEGFVIQQVRIVTQVELF